MNMLKCSAIFGSILVGTLTTALCATATLTENDIVRMSKAGVSDDAIIQIIQSTGSNFPLTAQDVDALKRNGLSERVLATMQVNRPTALSSDQPAGPASPVIREPGERDYVSVPINQQVVRALPVTSPAYYYQPPPSPPYYYHPYYYPVPDYYYYRAPVSLYYGHGGGRYYQR